MSTLRQEAISMVNALPEEHLSLLLQTIKEFMEKNLPKKTMHPDLPFTQEEWDAFVEKHADPQKAAAFQRLDALVKKNSHLYGKDFNPDQARWEALNEKYGPFD